MEIKKFDSALCINNNGFESSFIIGEVYTVFDVTDQRILFETLFGILSIRIETFENMFQVFKNVTPIDPTVQSVIQLPEYYNNENGSLYKVATERGWNAYLFDIVKRLERGGKKDPLRKEIEKSIGVLQLWLEEQCNE